MPTTTARSLPATVPVRAPTRPAASPSRDFAIGLMLASVAPAIFWVITLAGLSALFDYSFPLSALLIAGGIIATFLGVFFLALFAHGR